MKLIKNNQYLLLIDENAAINIGKYYFANEGVMKCMGIEEGDYPYLNQFGNYDSKYWNGIIIAYYPLTKEAKELNLPLLPNPINFNRFDKKFSLEDIEKAIEMAREITDGNEIFDVESISGMSETDTYGWKNKYTSDQIIQSLSYPKEFIPFKEYKNQKGEWKDVLLPSEWEVDTEVRIKLILNSEGKQELVGEYKY